MSLMRLAHFQDINAYDVIPLSGTLLMIGNDGLYQYDYKGTAKPRLLSVIPIEEKSTRK